MNQQAPPVCNVCGTPQNWVPPGTSRTTGMAYEGFWGCPNRKNHPPKSAGYPHTAYAAAQADMGRILKPQAAPQATNGHGPAPGARERSIEAQAACKAACDAFAGAGQQGMTPEAQREWIVALAQDLLSRVITPAVTGEDSELEFMR